MCCLLHAGDEPTPCSHLASMSFQSSLRLRAADVWLLCTSNCLQFPLPFHFHFNKDLAPPLPDDGWKLRVAAGLQLLSKDDQCRAALLVLRWLYFSDF